MIEIFDLLVRSRDGRNIQLLTVPEDCKVYVNYGTGKIGHSKGGDLVTILEKIEEKL